MSFLSRFFGRNDKKEDTTATTLIANPNKTSNLISLQIVFKGNISIDEAQLEQVLRKLDPSMKQASCQRDPQIETFFGLAGWGKHVIQMVGFEVPFPEEHLEACVAPSHYPAKQKEQIRHHDSHLLLWYAGYDDNVQEQYIALTMVAAALAQFNALAVLNEHAHTSLPIAVVSEIVSAGSMDMLRHGLPLTMLFCGFVKYEVDGVNGVWMRTYGAETFSLPNFAVLAHGHDEGQKYSDIFNNALNYLLESGAEMVAGHTMESADGTIMRLREPKADEYFLDGPDTVLVVEITAE